MREQTKQTHIFRNKDKQHVDFILTYDYSLRKEQLKPIGEIDYVRGIRLADVVNSLIEEQNALKEKLVAKEKEIIELQDKVLKLETSFIELLKGKAML